MKKNIKLAIFTLILTQAANIAFAQSSTAAKYYWTFRKRAEARRKSGKIKLAQADETKAAQIGRSQ